MAVLKTTTHFSYTSINHFLKNSINPSLKTQSSFYSPSTPSPYWAGAWQSVLEFPANSISVQFDKNGSPNVYAKITTPGQYRFALMLINEIGLRSYDTIEVTAIETYYNPWQFAGIKNKVKVKFY